MTEQSRGFTERALDILRETYTTLDDEGEVAISPAVLASRAYAAIDAQNAAPVLGQWLSVLQLRQLARGICRQRVEETDEGRSDLFTQLQPRYPVHRGGEELYVLRAHLSADEYAYNIARLRAEGRAKLAHADALQAEHDARAARGDFHGAA